MAKIVDNNKGFKVICMNNDEAANLGFGIVPGDCICMRCNNIIQDEIYYVAALNDVMCKSCYEKWYANATHYADDTKYENRYFDYYSKLLGL